MPRPPHASRADSTPLPAFALLRDMWASVPSATIESLVAGGRVVEFSAGRIMYAEADTEGLALVLQGSLVCTARLSVFARPGVGSEAHGPFGAGGRLGRGRARRLIDHSIAALLRQRFRAVAYTSIHDTFEHPANPCPPPGMRSTKPISSTRLRSGFPTSFRVTTFIGSSWNQR